MPEDMPRRLYGVLAHFPGPEPLVKACREIQTAGYRHWEAHSPYPLAELEEAKGKERSRLGVLVLTLSLAGGGAALLLQGWSSVVAYPLLVSGKPLFSWPAFVPILFECAILGGALGAFFGFLWLCRLPQPYHPLFSSTAFEGAGDDQFFLSIEARDPSFSLSQTSQLLRLLGAREVEAIYEPRRERL